MKRVFLLSIILVTSIISLRGQKNFNLGLLAQVEHPIESNDIWGYVDPSGIEYVVIGTDLDSRIYRLIDPTDPEIIAIIPGAQSIWRDFKSYDQYIYGITQRGEDGLTIMDMREAPDTVTFKLFKPSLTVGSTTTVLKTCHNIYIDEEIGVAYLAGCDIGRGGILIFDIATDPLNPIFLGIENERYSHDVVVKGDTLFSSEINEGNLGIYDVSDKNNPVLISRTQTSSSFTHNAWYSDDGNYVFTTDERANAFVDAYDIRDIESPIRIDQYQVAPGIGAIPHNTHYVDGYLVTSWYSEGVVILDAQRPDNLIKVGQYDTYTPNRVGFQGNWGVYPFLPSGLIVASDLAGGLFVLNPQYGRASYLEGTVVDAATGSPINGVQVILNDTDQTKELSRATGDYKTGTATAGEYQVVFSHPDFEDKTVTIMLNTGQVTDLDIRMVRRGAVFTVTGQVLNTDGEIIPEAQLIIQSEFRNESAGTNRDGFYRALLTEDTYKIYVAAWGYRGRLLTRKVSDQLLEPIILERGYEDDFFVDLGWKVTGEARSGQWIRAIPKATFFRGNLSNPDIDVESDLNDYCFVTGNNNASVGADDVDDGSTILTSPPINISAYKNPVIEISPWFFNDGGDTPANDTMKIYLIADDERTLTHSLAKEGSTNGIWLEPLEIFVHTIYKRAKDVRLQIKISDGPDSGHLVEGGIDRFRMHEGPITSYPTDQKEIEVIISPNPTDGHFYIDVFTNEAVANLKIFNITGRLVYNKNNPNLEINLPDLSLGTYLIDVEFESGVVSRRKFLKI